MKLRDVLSTILENDEHVDDSIIEFPDYGFCVSLFSDDKRIVFAPTNEAHELPEMVDAFVEILKEKYAVSKDGPKEVGTYEMTFDPREDFDSVLTFIKQQTNLEEDGDAY